MKQTPSPDKDTEVKGLLHRREGLQPAPPMPPTAAGIPFPSSEPAVQIPSRQKVLLEVVQDKVGIHSQTEALLRQANHPSADWDELVEGLRSRALGDFHYYSQHERAPEALSVLVDLLCLCLERCRNNARRTRAFSNLLDFLEHVLLEDGRLASCNLSIAADALDRLERWLHGQAGFASKVTAQLRKTIRRLLSSSEAVPFDRLFRIYAYALRKSYEAWLEQEDLERWFLGERDRLFDGRDYSVLFRSVSRGRIRHLLGELESIAGSGDALGGPGDLERVLSLAEGSELEQTFLRVAHEMEKQGEPRTTLHKIHTLLRLLGMPALENQHETLLWEVGYSLGKIRDGEESTWIDLLEHIFRVLHAKKERCGNAVLDVVQRVGQEVYRTENLRLLEVLQEKVIDLGFETPDVQGVTQDWQVVVNPLHVKNIRVWLSLIQMRPSRSRKLISALIVNLRLGGLFIKDTDLFQRDISRLLASNIRSCYALIKQLARLFPVYFHEIGAEGELREVTTTLDEAAGRQDCVVHFLRKQIHVESNSQVLAFVENLILYWATGNKEVLRPFLPPEVYGQIEERVPLAGEAVPIFHSFLDGGKRSPRDLLKPPLAELSERLRKAPDVADKDFQRAELVLRLYRLLARKYTIDDREVIQDLADSNFFGSQQIESLAEAIRRSDHERALDLILDLLSKLRDNILSEQETTPQEEIYQKRHIAVGIPSMYGRYKEYRFDSLRLTFRLESLARVLFEELVAGLNLEYVTRTTLERVFRILSLCARALQVDGIFVETLVSNMDLLRLALQKRGFTIGQYLNIFQFMARTLREITQTQYIAPHEETLQTVIGQLLRRDLSFLFRPAECACLEETSDQVSEGFIRDHLATSFAVQELDTFIGRVLTSLARESQSLDRDSRTLLLSYDPEKCFSSFLNTDEDLVSPIYLGNKGYVLTRLNGYGYPVPPGFIITTEFFRCRSAILAYQSAQRDFRRRLEDELKHIEAKTGKVFGDPNRPLLVSIRSGSPISMPGAMLTFLNIGSNEPIIENLARHPRFEWAAWDNYRRFLQCWGMSFGIPRDRFDELILDMKRTYSVRYKRELPPERMRELAQAYKGLIEGHAVQVPTNPWDQLHTAIHQVIESWYADIARLYRQTMKISEEWGTAVVVQQMVFGNLDMESGTGVVFTRNPKKTESGVSLFGDYTVCAQGEDVVAGLVETFPICEQQCLAENRKRASSLEERFPRIYRRLKQIAEDLIYERGFNHQNIEFTFEGADEDSLHILQARDMVSPEGENLQRFVPTPDLEERLLGTGIGVGGGALCGIAVHWAEEVDRFRGTHPDTPLILLRPDTVPDDIGIILKVDGILTARGGSTSHAAVTAYRLGKTCVVGCRRLQVNETESKSTIGDLVIRSGDWLGIDGLSGSIYRGRHGTTRVPAGSVLGKAGLEGHRVH